MTDKFKNKIITSNEYCNNCETEVKMKMLKQPCPNCGKPLIACNLCDYRHGAKCFGCDKGQNFKNSEEVK